MIWNIIEALALIGSLAAWLVTWSKLDEQKKLTQEERERRWDEISRAASIEKEKDAEIVCLTMANNDKAKSIQFCHAEYAKLRDERNVIQDHLSALLCPTNNHVWQDGVCVKCGRVKDAEIH